MMQRSLPDTTTVPPLDDKEYAVGQQRSLRCKYGEFSPFGLPNFTNKL